MKRIITTAALLIVGIFVAVNIHAQSFLTNGLVAFYPFNGNANDASGNGNNGILHPGIGFCTDRFGNTNSALYFTNCVVGTYTTGTPGLMETTIQQPASDVFTLAAWFNFPVGFTGEGIIQLKQKISGGYVSRDKWLSVQTGYGPTTNTLLFNMWPGYSVNIGSQITVADGTWHHAVATLSPAGMMLYLDGNLIATNSNTASQGYAGYWIIGNDGQGSMIDDVRIYNRALSSNEVAQLYAAESAPPVTQTWTWTLLQPSNNVPANFIAGNGAIDYAHGLVYSAQQVSGQAGSLIVYNMASNTFTTLPSAGWPGEIRFGCYVYDSVNNRILGWQDGISTVYAIPATGGAWQSLGGGSQTYTAFGNNKWWNPVSGMVNTFAGYGFGTFHNWIWQFNPSSGSWTQLQANTPNVSTIPWPRFGAWGQTYDTAKSRLFIYAGEGTSSGNQYQLDAGIPAWGSDGDMLQDLWMLNLTNQQWTCLIPATNYLSPPLAGCIVYYPPSDSIIQTYSASQTMATNLVMRFGLSDGSTNFSIIQTTGNPPPTVNSVNGMLPVYNAASSNIICFINQGATPAVYALTLLPSSLPLSISAQPQSTTNNIGDSAALSISTTNGNPLDIQWCFSGTNIDSGTNLTLTISNISQSYFGNYYVVVSNSFGSVTSSVATIYEPVTIISQPTNLIVTSLSPATFNVVAIGYPAPSYYQWTLNGTNINGANSNTLTITNVTLQDPGNYQVIASNSINSTTSSVVTLNMSPSITSPFIGATPIWGRSATLSVGAIGSGTLTYQWYFNGQAISGAVYPQLDFTTIQLTNSGFYSVVISSPYGSATNIAEQVAVSPSVVTLGFYPGLTINGAAGNSYIIQRSADLSNTNNWQTVSSLTMYQSVQLWLDTSIDATSPFNNKYFYQLIPQY